MALLVNTQNQTLRIGGVTLPPLGMGHSEESASKLREHLFVRSGWVEMNDSSPQRGRGKRNKPAKQEDAPSADGTEGSEAE